MATFLGAGYSTWRADTCTANSVLDNILAVIHECPWDLAGYRTWSR